MRVKLITMQRDEKVLLEIWLRYHGYIFGFENLIVIDNGSKDPFILETLRTYENVGVTVIRGFDTPRDFDAKGAIVGEVIRKLDSGPDYDYSIPIDCDELVGIWQDGNIGCSRQKIFKHLQAIQNYSGCFRVNSHLLNIPNDPGWYIPCGATRTFFRSNNFVAIDHGFHYGRSLFDANYTSSQLVYFHFHNKSYNHLISCSKNKLEYFIDPNDRDAVAGFNGPGCHLKENLLGTEEDYVNRYKNDFRIHIPELGSILGLLGLKNPLFDEGSTSASLPSLAIAENDSHNEGSPLVFCGDAYRRKWLDVSASGIDPLLHYVNMGRSEGRDIS